jgi:peptidoglycan/LPS O-acetylase OafA/YrhL
MLGTLLHRQPGLDLAPESPANADSPSRPQPPVRNRKLLRTVTIVFGLVLGVGLAVLFEKVKWKIGGDIVLFAICALLFGAFFKLRREGDSRETAVLIMAVSALLCAVISVLMDVPELLRNYSRARPLLNAARTMIIGLGIGAMVNEQLCKVVTARRRGTISLVVEPSQS